MRPPSLRYHRAQETIKLPPAFAPEMKLRGTEEVRFAPGMFEATSDTFFSYVFVFRLEGKPDVSQQISQRISQPISQKTLHRELLVYYRGLATAVLGSRGVKVDVEKFSLKLQRVKSSGSKESPRKGATVYTGKLDWIEPFVTRKSQTLSLEILTWPSATGSKARYVFCSVSPKKPSARIWKQMREVRDKFRTTIE